MIFKKAITFLLLGISFSLVLAQSKTVKRSNGGKAKLRSSQGATPKLSTELPVFNENIPLLIPQKRKGKSGFINQNGQFVISPEYNLVMFFGEDCNLLNSPNENVIKYGSADFATVEKNGISFRIDKSGKRVYQYQEDDLGKCTIDHKKAIYHAFVLDEKYGIIEDSKFRNPEDKTQYTIYPDYQFLFILEGDDPSNPMIVATYNDKFGVIDINNKIVIPFEYSDIKRNYSWKLGKMFEVTKDDNNYYFVDSNNHAY